MTQPHEYSGRTLCVSNNKIKIFATLLCVFTDIIYNKKRKATVPAAAGAVAESNARIDWMILTPYQFVSTIFRAR